MKKSRAVVKNKLNEWYDWLVDHVPKQIKKATSKNVVRLHNSILRLCDGVEKTLKRQTEDNSNLTAHKNERVPNVVINAVVVPNVVPNVVVMRCSGYHYCTTLFN